MNLPDAPIAHEGFFATHFFTVSNLDKSRDFYVRILGGKVIKPDNPCYVKLVNTWILLNSGGGPTPDKPEVFLETPSDLNRVSSFLNLRVADIWACYKQWGTNGAFFLTPIVESRPFDTQASRILWSNCFTLHFWFNRNRSRYTLIRLRNHVVEENTPCLHQ
jgi:hypothetical protein